MRATGTGRVLETAGRWHPVLAARYPQYDDPDTLDGGIEIVVAAVTGWAAADPQESSGK